MRQFSELLKHARRELNITQAEMGKRLKVSHNYVSQLEASIKQPGWKLTFALMELLNNEGHAALGEEVYHFLLGGCKVPVTTTQDGTALILNESGPSPTVTLTLPRPLLERAQTLMEELVYADLSALVAQLIRAEWDRRHPGETGQTSERQAS